MSSFQLSAFSFQQKVSRGISIFALALYLSAGIVAMPHAESEKGTTEHVERLFLEGRYEKVIVEASKLIDAKTRYRDELYYLKGLSELKTGRFEDSRESFSNVVEKYPRSKKVFDSYVAIGDSYFLQDNLEKASAHYSETAEKYRYDKNVALLYRRLGDCYGKMGLAEKAKSYYNKAGIPSPFDFETKKAPIQEFMSREIPRGEASEFISVQVGSFKNKRNAEKLEKRLSLSGYECYVETPAGPGDRLYRVKVGRFKAIEEAEAVARKLKREGLKTRICHAEKKIRS